MGVELAFGTGLNVGPGVSGRPGPTCSPWTNRLLFPSGFRTKTSYAPAARLAGAMPVISDELIHAGVIASALPMVSVAARSNPEPSTSTKAVPPASTDGGSTRSTRGVGLAEEHDADTAATMPATIKAKNVARRRGLGMRRLYGTVNRGAVAVGLRRQ